MNSAPVGQGYRIELGLHGLSFVKVATFQDNPLCYDLENLRTSLPEAQHYDINLVDRYLGGRQ